jgi:hypothetical protein
VKENPRSVAGERLPAILRDEAARALYEERAGIREAEGERRGVAEENALADVWAWDAAGRDAWVKRLPAIATL